MTAEEFNQKYGVGQRVIYHPVVGGIDAIETQTRTEAWTLSHGEPVVLVDGVTGGVALSALTVDED